MKLETDALFGSVPQQPLRPQEQPQPAGLEQQRSQFKEAFGALIAPHLRLLPQLFSEDKADASGDLVHELGEVLPGVLTYGAYLGIGYEDFGRISGRLAQKAGQTSTYVAATREGMENFLKQYAEDNGLADELEQIRNRFPTGMNAKVARA